ncbi:MAG: mechanosensitive ion channel family protein [Verrucomicrobiota bacterium]
MPETETESPTPEESSELGTAIQETAAAVEESAASVAQLITNWVSRQSWVADWLVAPLSLTLLVLGVLVAAVLVYLVVRPLVLRAAKIVISRSKVSWDDQLLGHGVFRWLSHLVPAVLLIAIAPGLFVNSPGFAKFVTVATQLYLVFAAFFLIDSILNAVHAIYRDLPVSKKFHIGTFVQVFKLIAILIGLILVISILIGRSPTVLLGGIGVFASVLMLVFKDVILGFAAGIQLASNQMLSLGDWLEMPSHSADGTVIEIGLTTVKVQNFDKTITTIPTYALISQPFKNWRGMSESDGRRIKRALLINTNTVKLCDAEMLDRFREIEILKSYLDSKAKALEEHNTDLASEAAENLVNGRRLTNVGTYRAYIEAYLLQHPEINQEMTLLVRQLAPVGRGLPIEIYCFSANKVWAEYERIQADIFDHLIAVSGEFELELYQAPSGTDPVQVLLAESLKNS